MIRRGAVLIASAALFALLLAAPAGAVEGPCEEVQRAKCFGLESAEASLTSTQAGAHPDLSFSFEIATDPESKPNVFALHDSYSATRNVRIELPPGLIGNPNVLGLPQQCTVSELLSFNEPGGGCPNGSQVGLTTVYGYELNTTITEPIFMMQPPGGEVAARIGFIAGIFPTFVDFKVRSESDYGLTAEIRNAPAAVRLLAVETTTWGVPADPVHDNERCELFPAPFEGCTTSPSRPPGSRPLPFLTNPTRCGVPQQMRFSASSWAEPERFDTLSAPLPEITGCNKLPFGPDLTVEPTNHSAAQPSGADVTIRLPASDGVNVLEPSQMKEIRVALPEGIAFNPGAADGLAVCSVAQVHYGERVAAQCPDAAKVADTEFDIPVLERRLKGAVYLREPEPGHLFRLWVTADDLGLHLKLKGELEVDPSSGQITEVTTEIPQAPVREAKIEFKSGFRAPLVNPQSCGEYRTSYEFLPWSGGPPLKSSTPMQINEGCGVGGFAPGFDGGTTNPTAADHSPFLFTLTRNDGEQNPESLEVTFPKGLAATFKGIPLCEGAAALSGECPEASRIGKITAAVGSGPFPLWVPQPDKRTTALYLGAPYKGGAFSVIAVVPTQAGPFDLGDEVVRSALHVDPRTAQGIVRSDPFPQIIEGIPVRYRTLQVDVDRPGFTLNPSGCGRKSIEGSVSSSAGAGAALSAPFQVANCANLPFKPRIFLKLIGGTKRGAFPAMHAVVRPRRGDSNLSEAVLRLPHSAFLEQGHIRTICTRVQFAQASCPPGSVYGHVKAFTPLLDETLEGNVYLRSSSHNLPDLVFALHGKVLEIESVGRIDSVKGGIRTSFEDIPDAPIDAVVLDLQGGRKGLIVNSRNLCARPSRATGTFSAQNGRRRTLHPVVRATKCKKHKHKRGAKRNSRRGSRG
jgi:hypothetical protein